MKILIIEVHFWSQIIKFIFPCNNYSVQILPPTDINIEQQPRDNIIKTCCKKPQACLSLTWYFAALPNSMHLPQNESIALGFSCLGRLYNFKIQRERVTTSSKIYKYMYVCTFIFRRKIIEVFKKKGVFTTATGSQGAYCNSGLAD